MPHKPDKKPFDSGSLKSASKILGKDGGFALILTILTISLLMAFTIQFTHSMRSNHYSAANLKESIRLGYLVKSGNDLARAILWNDSDSTSFDSLQEDWAVKGIVPPLAFDNGHLKINILDLSGRIQLNKLVKNNGKDYNEGQKKLLERFLKLDDFNLNHNDIEDLIAAIKDWIDNDSDTEFGAENDYYQSGNHPYSCRDKPLESLEELLLIKGMNKNIFYGDRETPGIAKYFTIHGDGKININTADLLVLRSLHEDITKEMVDEMHIYRTEENNEDELKNSNWYKKVPGMSSITIAPSLITISSTYFKIQSTGFKDAMRKQGTAIIERKNNKMPKILSWAVE